MGLTANAGTTLLGIAYAALLAGVGLWLADYARRDFRAREAIRILMWVAAALVAGHLLAAALLERRPLFVSVADFLAAGAAGMLAVAPLAGRGRASPIGALVLALAALPPALVAGPDAPPTVEQHTLLYVVQAAAHALGMGACIAALLGSLGEVAAPEEPRLADDIGIVVIGAGFILASAWAWLNWGIVWRNDPRLNLLAAGWLCVVAGHVVRRHGARWGPAAQWLGVALMLASVFAANFIATRWPGLSFVAW